VAAIRADAFPPPQRTSIPLPDTLLRSIPRLAPWRENNSGVTYQVEAQMKRRRIMKRQLIGLCSLSLWLGLGSLALAQNRVIIGGGPGTTPSRTGILTGNPPTIIGGPAFGLNNGSALAPVIGGQPGTIGGLGTGSAGIGTGVNGVGGLGSGSGGFGAATNAMPGLGTGLGGAGTGISPGVGGLGTGSDGVGIGVRPGVLNPPGVQPVQPLQPVPPLQPGPQPGLRNPPAGTGVNQRP